MHEVRLLALPLLVLALSVVAVRMQEMLRKSRSAVGCDWRRARALLLTSSTSPGVACASDAQDPRVSATAMPSTGLGASSAAGPDPKNDPHPSAQAAAGSREPGNVTMDAPAGGRSCESMDAATRDLLMSRLAALESEVASLLRQSPPPHQQQQQQQQHEQQQGTQHHAHGDGRSVGGDAISGGAHGEQAASQPGGNGGRRHGGSSAGWDDEHVERGGRKMESTTEAVAEGLSRLHPKVTRLVQSGFLESMHHLRQRLLMDDWEGGGRQRALQRGVADFEALCAEKDVALDWRTVSSLYQDPSNLDVIQDPKARMLARATLQRVLDERFEKVHEAATNLAKELADNVSKGPTNVVSWLGSLLPFPAFLKPR